MTAAYSCQPTTPQRESDQEALEASQIRELKLNHPKNYLAVPLAIAAEGDVDTLIETHAVNLPRRARRGARETGLLAEESSLTPLGEAVVTIGREHHGSPRNALDAFRALHASPVRFTDQLPEWTPVVHRVASNYEPTNRLVEIFREQGRQTLAELAWYLHSRKPAMATAVFIHPSVDDLDTLSYRDFTEPDTYRSEATFQFKAFLYHCGILESRGKDTSSLQPEADTWALTDGFGGVSQSTY